MKKLHTFLHYTALISMSLLLALSSILTRDLPDVASIYILDATLMLLGVGSVLLVWRAISEKVFKLWFLFVSFIFSFSIVNLWWVVSKKATNLTPYPNVAGLVMSLSILIFPIVCGGPLYEAVRYGIKYGLLMFGMIVIWATLILTFMFNISWVIA